MTAPKRIQRRRTKGWRMPAGAVYVGRPTVFGNPWRVGDPSPEHPDDAIDHVEAVELYVAWVEAPEQEWLFRMAQELTGLDLACWCPLDQLCHADVLLELANTPSPDPCATCGGPGANPMNGWHCSACRPVYQHRGDLAPQTGATR